MVILICSVLTIVGLIIIGIGWSYLSDGIVAFGVCILVFTILFGWIGVGTSVEVKQEKFKSGPYIFYKYESGILTNACLGKMKIYEDNVKLYNLISGQDLNCINHINSYNTVMDTTIEIP